ncbi:MULTISPECIES: MFS transporter [unclassified Crossiella]|uniref:MFS transporter n=1 Tax=unclassified Crossiella TaxID=2620835 RepID=UPI001FFEE30F|nr:MULTISPECIES: MFS transporter [unclassified Crossiella]MCK2239980.1 MFS transporter [Crossiella sp. S99.2]MCK2252688.1 MFS transporter [Crossiella sp. S99.1]
MTPHADSTTDERPALPLGMLSALALCVIPQALSSSALAVAMPAIREEFSAGPAVAWVISSTYLATGVGAIISGRLGDLFGHRRVLLVGLALASVATFGAMWAPGLGWLIGARVVIGLGTSAPLPTAMALLRRETQRRGISPASAGLGVIAVTMQLSITVGPTIGGLLLSWDGWRSIFAVTLPLLAAASVAVFTLVPAEQATAQRTGAWQKLDLPGMLIVACTITMAMILVLHAPALPWLVWAGALGQVALLVWWTRRAEVPFLRPALIADPVLSLTFVRNAAFYAAYYLIFYGIPLWLAARAVSAVHIGLVMLPLAAMTALTAAIAARAVRRRGPEHVVRVGSTALLLTGLAICVVVAKPDIDVAALVVLAGLCGIPAGCLSIGHQAHTSDAAPSEDAGAAAGLLRSAQYVGAVTAAACLPLLGLDAGGDAAATGLGWVVAGVGLVLMALRPRRQRHHTVEAVSR